RQCAGEFLPVEARCVVTGKQRIEPCRQVSGHRQRLGQTLAQDARHALFVIPVTAQVQAPASQQQGPRGLGGIVCRAGGAMLHQGATDQRLLPARYVEVGEQLRGQTRLAGQLAFGRQRQGKVRFFQRGGQVQAHVALAELVTGQRGGDEQQRRGGRLLFQQKGR